MSLNEENNETLVVTEENQQKGKFVRNIVTRILSKKELSDKELFELCDTLNDKSITELFLLEKLYK